ncbi:MAG: hypothetical protein JXA67_19455 [Micromonosporaceae bacterium]|nr:hypothetical protein [Micromonosporaceae bacterium]
MNTWRLAFPQGLDDEAWNEFVGGLGWQPVVTDDIDRDDVLGDDIDDQDETLVWRGPDGTMLGLVDDGTLEVVRLVVTGPQAEDAVRQARQRFSAVDSGAAVMRLEMAGTPDERARALYQIAAVVPDEPADDVIQAVVRCLRDPSRDVRLAAVSVAVYAPWPEFASAMNALAAEDPDHGVRAMAGNAAVLIGRLARE